MANARTDSAAGIARVVRSRKEVAAVNVLADASWSGDVWVVALLKPVAAEGVAGLVGCALEPAALVAVGGVEYDAMRAKRDATSSIVTRVVVWVVSVPSLAGDEEACSGVRTCSCAADAISSV